MDSHVAARVGPGSTVSSRRDRPDIAGRHLDLLLSRRRDSGDFLGSSSPSALSRQARRPLPGFAVLYLIVGFVLAACASGSVASLGPGRSASGPGSSTGPSSGATPDLSRVDFPTIGWSTDFGMATVDLHTIHNGGPPKDGIPSIDRPVFQSIAAARGWLSDASPVIALEVAGDARAYPLAILIWHEIVNDTVGGQAVVVTFCPLCDTALVWDRSVGGAVSDFGTTGDLRDSDLVMYDRQTESWWQQATGEAIVGVLAGAELRAVPAQIVALRDFAAAYPAGRVLSRDTGYERPYGENPYVGYDQLDSPPFLFDGVVDGRLPPKERTVTVKVGADAVAFPYSELAKTGVAQTTVGGQALVVFWVPGAASPLDRRDILGRDIGATGVFSPSAAGRTLTFVRRSVAGTPIRDQQTGSSWSVTGLATAGALAGTRLTPIVHGDDFWFAWAAFVPGTQIWVAP